MAYTPLDAGCARPLRGKAAHAFTLLRRDPVSHLPVPHG